MPPTIYHGELQPWRGEQRGSNNKCGIQDFTNSSQRVIICSDERAEWSQLSLSRLARRGSICQIC
eukprot:6578839-Ditylum_brightwellii.AAC.1